MSSPLFDSKWKFSTLGEVCTSSQGSIQTGPFGSQLHAKDYVQDGIPSIMPKNIGDNEVIEQDIARISLEDANRLSKYLVRAGDIVYSRRGDVEKRALITEKESGWLCGTGCLRVRFGNNSTVDPSFASYYLGHPVVKNWIVRHAVGATMPNLNTGILSDLPFLLPPIEEQINISNFLAIFDKKIRNNNSIIETLELLTRNLYQKWFVNFKFPDYEKVKLIDSDHPYFDLIPEGWNVSTISDVATFFRGRSYTSSQLSENDGEDFVNLKCFSRGGGFRRSGVKRYTGPIKQDQILKPRDIVVAVTDMTQDRAIVARAARVPLNLSAGATFSMDLIKLQAKPTVDENWLYAYLRLSGMADHVKQFANGANVLHLNPKFLMDYPIFTPSDAIRLKFSAKYARILDLIDNLEAQNNTLAQIRDLLLPNIVSGEKDISEFSNLDIQNIISNTSKESERIRV